jgi:hypothetical protein
MRLHTVLQTFTDVSENPGISTFRVECRYEVLTEVATTTLFWDSLYNLVDLYGRFGGSAASLFRVEKRFYFITAVSVNIAALWD